MVSQDFASFLEDTFVWIHLQLLNGVPTLATVNHEANAALFLKLVWEFSIQL